MEYKALLSKYPIISDQIGEPALGVVLRELEQILAAQTMGDVVELGCYTGTTTLFMRRLLDKTGQSAVRKLWAYDSFEGLPPKHGKDASPAGEQFQLGELAVSKKQFLQEFKKANLAPPITYKCWFNDITPSMLPSSVAFAFLDGDFYQSILDSLRHVWPRLAIGGVITIDDYQQEALPGVERAVNDFFSGQTLQLRHEHNIAIIKKS